MSSLDRLDRLSVAATRRVAAFAVLGMLAFSLLTMVDVSMRAWAGSPIAGLNEVLALILPITIVACFPAGVAQRVHLTIEFLARALPGGMVSWYRAIGGLLMLVVYSLLAWRMGVYAGQLEARGAVTTILQWPIAPAFWAVTFFIVLTVPAQFVATLVQFRDALRPDPSARSGQGGGRGRRIAFAAGAILAGAFVLAFLAGCLGLPGLEWIVPKDAALLAALLFLATWIMIVLFVPLGVSMTVAGLAGMNALMGSSGMLFNLGIQVSNFLSNVELSVLPLFLIMGSFVVASGLSSDLYRFAQSLLGHLRGGLALATIGGCAAFGAVTGLSVATVATIGRVAYPEMQLRGYSTSLSTGAIAAGGTLGMLVPPSGAMILYALLTEVSIGKMFVAALIPAAVTVLLYMAVIGLYVRLVPTAAPLAVQARVGRIRKAFVQTWGVLLLFGIVMGGIYGGIFTASEAAAVGAGVAFFYALAKGKLSRGAWWQVIGETVQSTAMIYLLLIGGLLFSNFVAIAELPTAMRAFITSLDLMPIAIVGILLVMYLILGCIMDPFAVMVITVPIFAPLIAGFGYDLIWWGIVMVVVIETGLVTPPLGINVFVLKEMAGDVQMKSIFKGVIPFVGANIVQLILLLLFPALALWLPSTM